MQVSFPGFGRIIAEGDCIRQVPAQSAFALPVSSDRSRHSAGLKRLATEQIAGLRRRIAGTEAIVQTPGHLADCCVGDDRPDCPTARSGNRPVRPPVLRGDTMLGQP